MIERKSFESQRLTEERAKDTRSTFTVSVNEDERKWLEQSKLALDIRSDSKALKVLAEAGKNVLFNGLGPKILRYLTKEKRQRYSDYKDIDKKFKENVLQEMDDLWHNLGNGLDYLKMTNFEVNLVDRETTTIKISKKLNELLNAYKVLTDQSKTKEGIVDKILSNYLSSFKSKLEGMKFK